MNGKTSISAIKDAIAHRDTGSLVTAFFVGRPPSLKEGLKQESECWDYKSGCPGHGTQNAQHWAQIAADVLSFYNTDGGALFFGIDDKSFSYCGTKTPIDAKQFNDKIRRYTGDKFWVSYTRCFQEPSGRYLGVALVPKRGLQVVPFFADAPPHNSSHYFKAGDIAVRTGDETRILRGETASSYLAALHIPNSDAHFLVNEPSYRILRPDWDEFVHRDVLCRAVLEGLSDDRTFVTSLTGIGGVGKTALACWGVLQAHEKRWFDYIISISAKDRELTSSGIREVAPTGSTLDQLLDSVAETIGFSELAAAPLQQKLKDITGLIKGAKMLLFVDNLETIQDPALISFLENLPVPVKAVLTSRKSLVRKAVFPIEVGQFELKEALSFLELIAVKKGRDFIPDMPAQERKLVVEDCFRIPLVVEWLVGSAKDSTSLIEAARGLELVPRQAEEVLEFSFRRIHTELSDRAQKVFTALSLFTDPQPIEALHAACSLPFDSVNNALEELLDASLVIRVFDTGLSDTTYVMLPITRRFAHSELKRTPELEQTLRRALTVWYEGSDISDLAKRKVMVAIRKAEKNPETLLVDAARQMRHQGKINEAEQFLVQALQRNPTSWKANRELGDLYKHDGKTTFALERYAKAASLAPKKGKDRALIFREYGIILRDAATPDALPRASDALEEALKETPNDPVCTYVLAQVLVRRGMHHKACPLLERLASSGDRQSRHKAYPLLNRCYQQDHDVLKLSELHDSASADGFQLDEPKQSRGKTPGRSYR